MKEHTRTNKLKDESRTPTLSPEELIDVMDENQQTFERHDHEIHVIQN